MKYPSKPEVGVGAVVIEGENILLIRRKYPPGAGKWSVPGGHVKLGESLYEAATRELREETGVEGKPLGIINIDEMVEYDMEGKIRYHYVLIDVLIEPSTPLKMAKASSDALELKVVPLKECLNLNLTRTSRSLIEKLISGSTCMLKSNFVTYKTNH